MNNNSNADWLVEVLRPCTSCGGCLAVCPSFRVTGDESRSARGRVTLLREAARGRLDLKGGIQSRLATCLDCGACAGTCPAGVDLPAAIRRIKRETDVRRLADRLLSAAARRLAVADGPAPAVLKLAAALSSSLAGGSSCGPRAGAGRKHLPHTLPTNLAPLLSRTTGGALTERLPQLSPASAPAPGPRTRVAFFPGCAANLMNPQIGLAAVRVMNAAGADVITPRGLHCCGRPLTSLGDGKTAARMLRANLRVLAAIDADAIITVCSTCALVLRRDLPRLGSVDRSQASATAARVQDVHEWLASRPLPEMTGELSGKLRTSGPLAVTWQDPCHMRWGLELYDEPRRILTSLPGVQYAETSSPGACCGGGGLFSVLQPGLSGELGALRAAEIIRSGPAVVATGCPSCQAQLADALARTGSGARVMHTVELIAAALPAREPASALTR